MNIFSWIRLFIRHWKYTIALPILAAMLTVVFTRNITRTYKTNTLIYTAVGSGYDVLTDPTAKIDRFGTMVNFDNLISSINSRSCIETATLRLLAWRLTTPEEYNSQEWKAENKLLADNLSEEILKKASNSGEEEMYEYLLKRLRSQEDPSLYNFIESVPSNYSIDYIRNTLKVKQKLSSDMLELIFTSNLPQVAKKTLDCIVLSFRDTYLGIKSNEAQNVVDYYEEQLNEAANKLRLAEERLKNFQGENNIINYSEQSKNRANSKEETLAELYYQQSLKASAQEAINKIESQINNQSSLFLFSREFTALKEKLSELERQTSSLELFGDTASNRYKVLKKEYNSLVQESKEKVKRFSENPESGMTTRNDLMTKWLENILDLNKANAKIGVINSRLKNFESTFQNFAPLGTVIKRLERQAAFAEEEYKNVLNSYNMSVLKLKDTQLSNALSIVDPPFMPQNAQPSKRLQLVILAGLITFILIGTILVILAYLDNTIKSIDNIKQLTNNEVIAAIPEYDPHFKDIDWDSLRMKQELNIGNSILAHFASHDSPTKTKFIGITSNTQHEGKHFVAEMLKEEFNRLNFSSRFYSDRIGSDFLSYPDHFLQKLLTQPPSEGDGNKGVRRLLINELNLDGSEDFVVFILPAFDSSAIPLPLLLDLDLQLKVVTATRGWTKSDDYLHNLHKPSEDKGMFIILNNMSPWDVEDIYGEIPKQRSWLRSYLKTLAIRLGLKNI